MNMRSFKSSRDYTSVLSAMSCSVMLLHSSVGSLSYLKELLKRAKCSSLSISQSVVKVNVKDLIQVGYCPFRGATLFTNF